ncbi:MAG: hypothetical protein E7381_03095 [Clostridiales bacterium]|nr:hypothetical protein [Clostridiales bacterium]
MPQKDKIVIPASRLHEGHRQRLLGKIDADVLQPHEYLEALLFAIEPRRDTNPIAHRLLYAFGSPHGVFNASVESLMKIEGVGKKTAQFLRSVGGLVETLYEVEECTFPTAYEHGTFYSFLKMEYANEAEEVADVYFLTEDGYIFYRKRLSVGEEHYAESLGSDLQEAIVTEMPYAIILVHTHPHATADPSQADFQVTEICQRICYTAGVMLADHLIYSPDGIYSFYQSGALCKIAEQIVE